VRAIGAEADQVSGGEHLGERVRADLHAAAGHGDVLEQARHVGLGMMHGVLLERDRVDLDQRAARAREQVAHDKALALQACLVDGDHGAVALAHERHVAGGRLVVEQAGERHAERRGERADGVDRGVAVTALDQRNG
jgi:hypothetical protein